MTVRLDLQRSVAWELRSARTSAIARCLLEEHGSGVVVRVVHGGEEVTSWWHGTRQHALERADAIHSDLVRRGWKTPVRQRRHA